MRNARYPLVAIMVVVTLISSVSAICPQPSGENCEYFAETGHYVCAEFLDFFKTLGELEIFGYPLTEAFPDRRLKLQVQYFQRARMELHPHSQGSYQVLLGALVDELGYRFPAVDPEQVHTFNGSTQRYFPETGHTVSYAFLDYFRERGGLDVFGYPRSEPVIADGYVVQYFQRARMEWHPEAFPSPQIRLTNLGEICIERFGVPGNYDEPRSPPGRTASIVSTEALETRPVQLNINASVRHIISGQEGIQTVFAYVTDQWRQPVQGAAVEIAVHYRSGAQCYEFVPTDESGFTSHSFDIPPAPPGHKVVIDVTASYGDLTGVVQTFFLPWW